MPDWCSNHLVLTHNDPAMIARTQAAYEQGQLLQELVPGQETDCRARWGTAWDIGGQDCDISRNGETTLILNFSSVDTPPLAAMQALVANLGFEVKLLYSSPHASVCGRFTNTGGHEYFIVPETLRVFREQIPEEIDDAFNISEDLPEDEGHGEIN